MAGVLGHCKPECVDNLGTFIMPGTEHGFGADLNAAWASWGVDHRDPRQWCDVVYGDALKDAQPFGAVDPIMTGLPYDCDEGFMAPEKIWTNFNLFTLFYLEEYLTGNDVCCHVCGSCNTDKFQCLEPSADKGFFPCGPGYDGVIGLDQTVCTERQRLHHKNDTTPVSNGGGLGPPAPLMPAPPSALPVAECKVFTDNSLLSPQSSLLPPLEYTRTDDGTKYHLGGQPMAFAECEAYCREQDATLACLHPSQVEDTWEHIAAAVAANASSPWAGLASSLGALDSITLGAWVGAHHARLEGTFEWTSVCDAPPIDAIDQHWLVSDRRNAGGLEQCVAILPYQLHLR